MPDLVDIPFPLDPATEIMADGTMLLRGEALPYEKYLLTALGGITSRYAIVEFDDPPAATTNERKTGAHIFAGQI